MFIFFRYRCLSVLRDFFNVFIVCLIIFGLDDWMIFDVLIIDDIYYIDGIYYVILIKMFGFGW